jgi:hypothetical protein
MADTSSGGEAASLPVHPVATSPITKAIPNIRAANFCSIVRLLLEGNWGLRGLRRSPQHLRSDLTFLNI